MLENINAPAQLKQLSLKEKYALAAEIREIIIDTVKKTGGHLASNLGAIEMTIALHSVLDTPGDKLIFDVGHQCYTHKLLTGRYKDFETLRQFGGISGFTRPNESEYDLVASGHASDSISIALGYAKARDLKNGEHHVAAVVGDGALTGGMCYEALNDAGQSHTRMLIVLNDNEMSISQNVGSLSKHLTHMRQSSMYRSFKQLLRSLINRLPKGSRRLESFFTRIKNSMKTLLVSDMFFGALDIEYLGPIDGHDIAEMEKVFKKALTYREPVVVHVVTRKGKGYEPAEKNPSAYHGVSPKMQEAPSRHANISPCGKAVGDWLIKEAQKDESIVCISAAMLDGTGLDAFKTSFPQRCFDVGIAEEHGAAFAAGLALNGLKPYIALYSTFAQRAYDQINLNICLNRAPVKLLIDRSGLNGADGETHQGVFDTSYLSAIPGLIVSAPSTIGELRTLLHLSLSSIQPFAIKYPKMLPDNGECDDFALGTWATIKNGHDIALISYGRMVSVALEAAEKLNKKNIDLTIVNARFIKPFDKTAFLEIQKRHESIYVLEDCVKSGSLAQALAELTRVKCLCVPDEYIPAGTIDEQLRFCGLDADSVCERILKDIKDRENAASRG